MRKLLQIDFEAYVTYFIDEEEKGIREYEKFLRLIENDSYYHRLSFIIKNIIADEKLHLKALKRL